MPYTRINPYRRREGWTSNQVLCRQSRVPTQALHSPAHSGVRRASSWWGRSEPCQVSDKLPRASPVDNLDPSTTSTGRPALLPFAPFARYSHRRSRLNRINKYLSLYTPEQRSRNSPRWCPPTVKPSWSATGRSGTLRTCVVPREASRWLLAASSPRQYHI